MRLSRLDVQYSRCKFAHFPPPPLTNTIQVIRQCHVSNEISIGCIHDAFADIEGMLMKNEMPITSCSFEWFRFFGNEAMFLQWCNYTFRHCIVNILFVSIIILTRTQYFYLNWPKETFLGLGKTFFFKVLVTVLF